MAVAVDVVVQYLQPRVAEAVAVEQVGQEQLAVPRLARVDFPDRLAQRASLEFGAEPVLMELSQ